MEGNVHLAHHERRQQVLMHRPQHLGGGGGHAGSYASIQDQRISPLLTLCIKNMYTFTYAHVRSTNILSKFNFTYVSVVQKILVCTYT